MRMWPVSSSSPPHKIQGCTGISVRVTFGRHRRMTCMVGRRLSRARSKAQCVGPLCTIAEGTASYAAANGVWALVRAAKECHSISLTRWRACMEGTCGLSTPSSLGTKRVACSFGNKRCTGGAFAWAATKSGSSSGTDAKCELCCTTQWWGPPIVRGSRRSPSKIQFNASVYGLLRPAQVRPYDGGIHNMYCVARRRDVEQVRCLLDDLHLGDGAADGTHPHGP